jgi:predicted MFS family arabinose efflux permease
MFQIALALSAAVGGVVAGAWSLRRWSCCSVLPQVLCLLVALRFGNRGCTPAGGERAVHLGSALGASP